MKIETLYEQYLNLWVKNEKTFDESGMKHVEKKLHFGFFPFGTGKLIPGINRETAEINEGGVMILGNDFGTQSYLDNQCDGDNEKASNSTIRNLTTLLKNADIKMEDCFCTNFYMGVRKEGSNIKRDRILKNSYKVVCFDFFLKQIELTKPRLVICLGNDARVAIVENMPGTEKWDLPAGSILNICTSVNISMELDLPNNGKTRFVLLPHPSYAVNLTEPIIQNFNNHVRQR